MSLNNDTQKNHLQKVENTLNNISNTTELSNTIHKTSLDLSSALGAGKNLYIDDDIRRDINGVHTRLQAGQLDTEIRNEITTLNGEERHINTLPDQSGYTTRISEIGRRRDELRRIRTGIAARRTEYTKIQAHANRFDVSTPIPEQSANITVPAPRLPLLPLNPIFVGTNPKPTYQICDENGVTLTAGSSPNTYTIQIGGQSATLSGVQITGNQLDLRNVMISPLTIDISQPIKLSITGSYNNVGGTGINVAHNKKFDLSLHKGPAPTKMENQALRDIQIDAYNASGPTPGVIQRSLEATYNNDLIKLEKEAIFNALKKLDGPKFEKLNDAQKDELFDQFRTRFDDPSLVIDGINIHHHIRDINDYNTMKNWMSDDNHASNTPEHTKSQEAYRNYIHNNLEDQTGKYISAQLDTVFSDNLEVNMYLKSELSNFFTNIENRKVDNNTHADIYQTLSDDAMESKKSFGLFGSKDVNYLRFFEGKNSETIKGTVKINTEREGLVSGKKYPDPIDYDISVAVKKNSVQSSIRIPGIKDITLKGREPNAIIREILRRKDIPFGKLRMGIAYSFLKAMVQMASDSHINLDYTDPRSGEKRRIRMEDSKIIIEQYDDNTQNNSGGGYRRLETIAFDETMFENSQEWDSSVENRSLRRGIEYLSQEFNCAMNQTHRHYKAATERKRFGLKKGEMRTTLPTSFFLSPIKSIRKWFGEKMDFPFTTSVSSGGKTANIEFTGKQFKITMGEKTYTNNNLGSILHKREGGLRVFDGIEREICATVYKKLIEGIRGNKRVENKNFGVVDPMTKGVYMIDVDGDRSYIEPEDKKRANIKRSKFMKGVFGAALGASAGVGAGVGGALWAGVGLVKGGWIGARVGALAGGLLGGATAKNNYGEIPNPPTTRRVLSDKEKEQLYHNPLLMSRIMRAMSDGLR